MSGPSYTIAYSTPTNTILNQTSVKWHRDILPSEDSFQITAVAPGDGTNNFSNNPFLLRTTLAPTGEVVFVARNVFISRNDASANQFLMFMGVITDIQYTEDTTNGWQVILTGYGSWYLLQCRLVAIPNASFTTIPSQGQYPIYNPWIPILNPVLNLPFNFLFELIVNTFTQQSSYGLCVPIQATSTDFDATTTTTTRTTNAGVTTVGVVSTTGFAVNDLIFISNATNYSNTSPLNPPPVDNLGETSVISAIPNGTTLTLAFPTNNSYNTGAFIWNNIVNDQMFLQYTTVDNAIQRLIQSGIGQSGETANIGEVDLIFRNSLGDAINPIQLTVKYFNGISNFGVGIDRSVGPSGPGVLNPAGNMPIVYYEGSDITSINFEYSFDSMANSVVITGEQFQGSQVAAAEKRIDDSVTRYGLKQISRSMGNVADPLEINRYLNNLIPLTAYPVPTLTFILLDEYLNTEFPNPGDIITIESQSLADVAVLNTSVPAPTSSFNARVKSIDVSWDATNGEVVTLTLTYPVIQGSQWFSLHNSTNEKTIIGSMQQEVRSSLYYNESSTVQNMTQSYTFEVSDRVDASGIVHPDQFIQRLNIDQMVLQNGAGSSQTPTLYGFYITITTQRQDVTTVNLTLAQPDGLTLFSNTIAVNQRYNLITSTTAVTSPTGELLNVVSGNYTLTMRNTAAIATPAKGGDVTYSALVEVSYILNRNQLTTVGTTSLNSGLNTGTTSGNSSTPGSVVAGTKAVIINDGAREERNIEDIKVDDIVLAYDDIKSKFVESKVIRTSVIKAYALFSINRGLLVGDDFQPILVEGRGWRKLKDIEVGDRVYKPIEDKWVEVQTVEITKIDTMVYDLDLAPCKNYVANGILVNDSKFIIT